MHFIVLFTDLKTEKGPHWLNITKWTVIAEAPHPARESFSSSKAALAAVCVLISPARCLMMLTCQWWCAGPRRGVFDKLERTRSRWSRDNWNRPDLNSQPVSHRGAGTGPGDIITCESMRVLSRGRGWRWCRSLWPPLWGPPGATPDCFRIILKYLKTGPPRRNCLFFFTGRIKIQEIMKTNERLIAEI